MITLCNFFKNRRFITTNCSDKTHVHRAYVIGKNKLKKIILPSNVTLANQILNLRSSRTLPAIKIGA